MNKTLRTKYYEVGVITETTKDEIKVYIYALNLYTGVYENNKSQSFPLSRKVKSENWAKKHFEKMWDEWENRCGIPSNEDKDYWWRLVQ